MTEQNNNNDGNNNELEYLTGTQPTNQVDAWEFTDLNTGGSAPTLSFDRVPGAGFDVQVSTNLISATWSSLDVPENAPVFSPITTMATVPDPEGTNLIERYYRMRVYDP